MRLSDITENRNRNDQPVKARDPNWRDMEALRRSGAAGSHGDKTKTIPRKEKYKRISTDEANPNELGPMNDKMRDALSKVHADDQEQAKAKADADEKVRQQAEKERQAKAAELGDEGMQDYINKLKSHDWYYDYSDDHRSWTRGRDEYYEIMRLQKILDPKLEIYKQYSPFHKEETAKKESRSSVMAELDKIDESATAGATSAGNIASVANPHVAIGNRQARRRYGQRGENPSPPKAKMQKPTDNALDMKGTSIFGGTLKRNM